MGKAKRTIWRIAREGQRHWDRLKLEVKDRVTGFEPLVLLAYRGHATRDGTLRITARLIEEKGVKEEGEDASALENIANTIRRLESDEIPDAWIVARCGETAMAEGRTDHEGFIRLDLPAGELDPGWVDVELELMESRAGGAGLQATAPILVPPDAEFAVISDVDDTVLKTRATDLVTELRLILSNSAAQRVPMPGAPALYRMLEGGRDRDGRNPVFYVSNSGWGLYDLIETFLDRQDLPLGPLYLQDIAIVEPKSPEVGAESHKRATIERLLDDYPDMPFVLIGDSGQHDPETYRAIVEDRPDRVRAVLIRDVAPPERDAEVRGIVQEIIDHGVDAAAAESSISLARAAADFGLIPEDGIAEVREAMVGHGS